MHQSFQNEKMLRYVEKLQGYDRIRKGNLDFFGFINDVLKECEFPRLVLLLYVLDQKTSRVIKCAILVYIENNISIIDGDIRIFIDYARCLVFKDDISFEKFKLHVFKHKQVLVENLLLENNVIASTEFQQFAYTILLRCYAVPSTDKISLNLHFISKFSLLGLGLNFRNTEMAVLISNIRSMLKNDPIMLYELLFYIHLYSGNYWESRFFIDKILSTTDCKAEAYLDKKLILERCADLSGPNYFKYPFTLFDSYLITCIFFWQSKLLQNVLLEGCTCIFRDKLNFRKYISDQEFLSSIAVFFRTHDISIVSMFMHRGYLFVNIYTKYSIKYPDYEKKSVCFQHGRHNIPGLYATSINTGVFMETYLDNFKSILLSVSSTLNCGNAGLINKRSWWNQRFLQDRELRLLTESLDRDLRPILTSITGFPGCFSLFLDKNLVNFPIEHLGVFQSSKIFRVPFFEFLTQNISCSGMFDVSYLYCFDKAQNLSSSRQLILDFSMDNNINYCTKDRYKNGWNGVFCYIGHNFIRKEYNKVVFMFGCSSAKVRGCRNFNSNGVAIDYLQNGTILYIGCLWDVTDSDLNRLTLYILKHSTGKISEMHSVVKSGLSEMKLQSINGAAIVLYGFPFQ